MRSTLLLMGHGSQDAAGLAEFSALVEAVRATAPHYEVEAGWLEFAGNGMPTIQEAIARCAQRGDQRILAVPLLLHRAGHSKDDVPTELTLARRHFPSLEEPDEFERIVLPFLAGDG